MRAYKQRSEQFVNNTAVNMEYYNLKKLIKISVLEAEKPEMYICIIQKQRNYE